MSEQELLDQNSVNGMPLAPIAPERSTEIIDRREFLDRIRDRAIGTAAVLLVAQYGALATEVAQRTNDLRKEENKIWPRTKPSFTLLDGAEYKGQKRLSVYLPGFGDMHSLEEAQVWKETSALPKDRLTGAVDYSNYGANIDEITDAISEKVDMKKIEAIDYVGRSIGGLFLMPTAIKLGKPVQSALFISAPSRLTNGDYGEYGKYVSYAPRSRFIATICKYLFNTWQSRDNNGNNLGENMAKGWQATVSGADPLALEGELKIAAPINIQDRHFQTEARQVFLPKFTTAAYAATDYPASDTTVKVIPSGREFQQVFDGLGIDFSLIGVPYRGHANVEATAKHMRKWTQASTATTKTLALK